MSRDLRNLLRAAEKQGFKVSRRRGGHVKIVPPGGGPIIFAAHSPSDHRAVKNVRAYLRRAGYDG